MSSKHCCAEIIINADHILDDIFIDDLEFTSPVSKRCSLKNRHWYGMNMLVNLQVFFNSFLNNTHKYLDLQAVHDLLCF